MNFKRLIVILLCSLGLNSYAKSTTDKKTEFLTKFKLKIALEKYYNTDLSRGDLLANAFLEFTREPNPNSEQALILADNAKDAIVPIIIEKVGELTVEAVRQGIEAYKEGQLSEEKEKEMEHIFEETAERLRDHDRPAILDARERAIVDESIKEPNEPIVEKVSEITPAPIAPPGRNPAHEPREIIEREHHMPPRTGYFERFDMSDR